MQSMSAEMEAGSSRFRQQQYICPESLSQCTILQEIQACTSVPSIYRRVSGRRYFLKIYSRDLTRFQRETRSGLVIKQWREVMVVH